MAEKATNVKQIRLDIAAPADWDGEAFLRGLLEEKGLTVLGTGQEDLTETYKSLGVQEKDGTFGAFGLSEQEKTMMEKYGDFVKAQIFVHTDAGYYTQAQYDFLMAHAEEIVENFGKVSEAWEAAHPDKDLPLDTELGMVDRAIVEMSKKEPLVVFANPVKDHLPPVEIDICRGDLETILEAEFDGQEVEKFFDEYTWDHGDIIKMCLETERYPLQQAFSVKDFTKANYVITICDEPKDLQHGVSDKVYWEETLTEDLANDIFQDYYGKYFEITTPQGAVLAEGELNDSFTKMFLNVAEKTRNGNEMEIDGYTCRVVDAWQNGTEDYVLGQDMEEGEFFYAQVTERDEPWKGVYNYEYDKQPTRQEVEEDHLNRMSELEIDRQEAEYGADGRRAFPHLHDEEPGVMQASVKDWYCKSYSNDELGEEIPEALTFERFYQGMEAKQDVYEMLGGAGDSVVRERIFTELAKRKGVDYDVIYDLWLNEEPRSIEIGNGKKPTIETLIQSAAGKMEKQAEKSSVIQKQSDREFCK